MFAIGDKVVRKPRGSFPTAGRVFSKLPGPPRGKVIIVDGVVTNPAWDTAGLIFNQYPSDHLTRAWSSIAYEKVVAADADFCEMIRGIKPKIKEDA